MSNVSAEPKPYELNEEELERVTGGSAKNTTGKNNTEGVSESLSLNFTKIMFT